MERIVKLFALAALTGLVVGLIVGLMVLLVSAVLPGVELPAAYLGLIAGCVAALIYLATNL